jgi:hypothetical protein
MQKLAALFALVLVSCAPAIAGVNPADFPLRVVIADPSIVSHDATATNLYKLGTCIGDTCDGGSQVVDVKTTVTTGATINGVTYLLSGPTVFPAGTYAARLKGKTLEIVCKDPAGKVITRKLTVLSVSDPNEVCTAAKCGKPLN